MNQLDIYVFPLKFFVFESDCNNFSHFDLMSNDTSYSNHQNSIQVGQLLFQDEQYETESGDCISAERCK